MKYFLFIVFVFCFAAADLRAQDTFHVKKKRPQPAQLQRAAWDTTNRDSIVSYTVEYQKPGSNIYVVLHKQGPYLIAPWEATQGGKRVLFTEIIAVDSNGRKYRQPDRYYAAGRWVPVKEPK